MAIYATSEPLHPMYVETDHYSFVGMRGKGLYSD